MSDLSKEREKIKNLRINIGFIGVSSNSLYKVKLSKSNQASNSYKTLYIAADSYTEVEEVINKSFFKEWAVLEIVLFDRCYFYEET